jgi:hypothetical protein
MFPRSLYVSRRNGKGFITPYVIGASDLAFILLFFFIVVGGSSKKIDKIEMPHKRASASKEPTRAPFRIEIYDNFQTADSCNMTLIFEKDAVPETLYVEIGDNLISKADGYRLLEQSLSRFVSNFDVPEDSVRFDIFSSVYSYYGLVAISLAACNHLNYPCNLVYRAESG